MTLQLNPKLLPSEKTISQLLYLKPKYRIFKNSSQNQTDFYTTCTNLLLLLLLTSLRVWILHHNKHQPRHCSYIWSLGVWDVFQLSITFCAKPKPRWGPQSYLRLFMATSTVVLFIARQLAVLFVLPLWPLVANWFGSMFLFFQVGEAEGVMIAIQANTQKYTKCKTQACAYLCCVLVLSLSRILTNIIPCSGKDCSINTCIHSMVDCLVRVSLISCHRRWSLLYMTPPVS